LQLGLFFGLIWYYFVALVLRNHHLLTLFELPSVDQKVLEFALPSLQPFNVEFVGAALHFALLEVGKHLCLCHRVKLRQNGRLDS